MPFKHGGHILKDNLGVPMGAGGGLKSIVTDVPNALFLLDGNRGVFEESTYVTPSVNGAAVGGWQDQMGAHPATVTGAGNKPTYATNQVGGRAAVVWDTTPDDWLLQNSMSAVLSGDNPAFSLVLVYKARNLTGTQGLWSLGNSGTTATITIKQLNAKLNYTFRDDAGVLGAPSSAADFDTNWHIHIIRVSATVLNWQVDTTPYFTNADLSGFGAFTFNQVAAGAQANVNPNSSSQGSFAMLAGYARAISTAEVTQLYTQLRAWFQL